MSDRGGVGGRRGADAGSVVRGLVGMGVYWFLAAIWAGLGALAGFAAWDSANDPKEVEWWPTALAGAVCGGLLLLALLFAYLGVRGLLQTIGVLGPTRPGRGAVGGTERRVGPDA